MMNLVRAELLKLRTVRLPLWLLVTTLVLTLFSVVATVLTAGLDGSPIPRDSPDLLALAAASASSGSIVLLILGIMVLTQEFRFGTATPSFLVTPKRWKVLVAKLIGVAIAGLVFAVIATVVALVAAAALISLRGDALVFDGRVVQVLLGVGLVMLLYGPIGVGVGALVRNQIAAIVGVLAFTFIVEQLVIALLPEVGKWLPGGAANAVLQLGEVATTNGSLLPVWGGALLLIGYALVFSALGAALTLRRDLT